MTPPLEINADVKEAVNSEIKAYENLYDTGHHVQTLLNARLKEKDDLFKQSDIERRAFITDLESIIEGLRRELLSQALTIERMREAIKGLIYLDEMDFGDESILEQDNPTHALIVAKKLLTAPQSDTLREVAEMVKALEKWNQSDSVLGLKEFDQGLLCGVEDRGLQTIGYEAMRFGYDRALERVSEEIDGTIQQLLKLLSTEAKL